MSFRPQFRSRINLFFGVLCLTVLSLNSALAQTGTSSVRGTVADSQGQVVAGANVTLKSTAKSFTRTQVTSSGGDYVFTSIPPDTYTLEIEASGFKKTVVPAFEALVDTPKTIDAALEVGQVSETVTVSSGTEAALNTTDATIGNTFNQRKVIDLPLPDRETANLLSLQPGVTPQRADQPTLGGSVNGGRSDQANVTLDGVDVNEQQGGTSFFSVLRVTPEALQEFRVTTTNANADQGRSSGAQISLVTKSGGNQFHGSGYIYHRPKTAGQANDFFNNKAGVPQIKDGRNTYGGSFLGPIVKDKLFFALFYERFVESRETTIARVVPLATLGQGIVRYRTDDGSSDPTCPAGTPSGVRCLNATQINDFYTAAYGVTPGTNPLALSALAAAAARYPANDTTLGDGLNTGGFRFNAPIPIRRNVATLRLDNNLTKNQTLFARYTYQYDNEARAQRFPDTIQPTNWIHPQGIAVGHTWTVNNNAVNKFTYGFTRDSFTLGGDSTANAISFRNVFSPSNFSRATSRITPVHNFVDDFTYVWGNHTLSTGGNIRLISNQRTSTGSSYDFASANLSFYNNSGADVVTDADGNAIFPNVSSGSDENLRNALTAVIGRFSQYTANLQYAKDGSLLPVGSASVRDFRTQEYEFYGQDSWKLFNNLTVNYGLRWSTSTPVYEANGLQVKPTTSLNDFFNRRVAAAYNGQADNELISVDLAGKANGKSGYYKQDWNNFAPSISAAWSPNFKGGMLKKIFGGEGKSTIRGGFRMTYDRIGSALAVAFDLNSTLGYSAAKGAAANTFSPNSPDDPTGFGPLFTGFNQDLRGPLFFGSTVPVSPFSNSVRFPLQTAPDEDQRIEQSLDDKLTTPYNYNFNLSYGREVYKGLTVEASYVGRFARKLLVSRDTAHFNNLRDPQSGQDFYGVMRQLVDYRNANAAITSIPNIAWFNRFVPGLARSYNINGQDVLLTATQAAYRRVARSCSDNAPRDENGNCTQGTFSINGRNTTDFTFIQLLWDDGLGAGNNLFIQPQYATFAAYSTIGSSDYNGAQLSIRKRFDSGFSFDFNYTYAHSLDTASGTEAAGGTTTSSAINSGASLILNPLDLKQNRGSSDFDVRHLINANFVYQLPFGTGKQFFGNTGKLANAFLGGWTLTGIYRWNTGFPIGQPFDDSRWATNWNVQSNGVALTRLQSSPDTRSDSPNIFSDPVAAYRSYRNPLPGEAGDRNILREPNYVSFDAGLQKDIRITETSKLNFRVEAFNVTNTQRFTGIANFGLGQDPFLAKSQGGTPPSDFGRFTQIQGSPRTIQFVARFDF